MKQYPIWNQISSCAYKNSNKSYGVREHSEIKTFVGSSVRHSHHFCTIKQTRKTFGDWFSFCLWVDGNLIKQTWFNNKTKEYKEHLTEKELDYCIKFGFGLK